MVLQIQSISKSYQIKESGEHQVVLNNISLDIKAGDNLAIVGPSGSGKSTLLNIMGTLDEPVSGDVLINGLNIKSLGIREIATIRNKTIGFVFQKHHLLPQLNLIENALLPSLACKDKFQREDARQRAFELFVKLGLEKKLQQFPGNLSVGECQRAAVVRALINQPQIILADEPTGSLDNASAENLGNLLKSVSTDFGVALVVVTHSIQLAGKMNRIFKLEDGKLNSQTGLS